MSTFKLPYGIKENELVTIDDVERGLKCDCVCPSCGKRLIAKKGEINEHHFAHYQSEDCLGGLETILHKLSKDIISKSATFTTPPVRYPKTKYDIFDSMEIPIDKVSLEKRLGSMIPDIIIESKAKKLIVEIVVTNVISSEKLYKIEEENIATMAVYVKDLLEILYSQRNFLLKDDLFRRELIHGTKFKYWIHNPKIELFQNRLKNNYADEIPITYFKTSDDDLYQYVENCPLEGRRFFQGGPNKGKPYVSVDYDCRKCKYFLDIDYFDKIYCIGQYKDGLSGLIRLVKENSA